MLNDRNRDIIRLRTLCEDPDATPTRRMKAATNLLAKYGPTRRNLVVVKNVIAALENYQDASLTKQKTVREDVEQLENNMKFSMKSRDAQKDFDDESDAEADLPVSAPTSMGQPVASFESTQIGGLELLPPDEEDKTGWDRPGKGNTRRQRFCMAWNLPTVLTRAQIIQAITSDPAKIRSHTVELKLWSRTREQLDKKFMEDQAEIRKLLAEHKFADAISGLNDLVKYVESKHEPLVEFRPSHDPDGSGLPQLVRSRSGLLLDKIDFVATWQQQRNHHRSL